MKHMTQIHINQDFSSTTVNLTARWPSQMNAKIAKTLRSMANHYSKLARKQKSK